MENEVKKLTPEQVADIIAQEEKALADKKALAEMSLPASERVIKSVDGYDMHPLDYDKVNRLEDVIAVLKTLDLRFSQGSEPFNQIKHLLKGV